MSKPLTDISNWMQEHVIELSPVAYLSLEQLLRKYHRLKPPMPLIFEVVEMGDHIDWSRFENGNTND